MRAGKVIGRGGWSGQPADSVVLDFDDRHRRRLQMTGVGGLSFLLDLPNAVALRGGDALALDDGRLIEVVAAPEPLAELRASDAHEMVRLAWHLGNRHLPTQIVGQKLRIRRDSVIEDMAKGLGASVRAIEAPFDPEGGAYASGGAHGHAHHDHHDHGHDHHHGHNHDHHGHDGHGHHHHGPGCGCDGH